MRTLLALVVVLSACAADPAADEVELAGEDDGKADGVQGRKVTLDVRLVNVSSASLASHLNVAGPTILMPVTSTVRPTQGTALIARSELVLVHTRAPAFEVWLEELSPGGEKGRFFVYQYVGDQRYDANREVGMDWPHRNHWELVTCTSATRHANYFSRVAIDRVHGTLTTGGGVSYSLTDDCGIEDPDDLVLAVFPFAAWSPGVLDGSYAMLVRGDCHGDRCWIE
jgi:hypothetical protein